MSEELTELEFQSALRRMLALASMVDGEIDPSEVEVLQKVYRAVASAEMDESDLFDEVSELALRPMSVGRYVQSLAPRLSWDRKQTLLKAALLVSGADGTVKIEEDALVQGVASALARDSEELERLVRAVQHVPDQPRGGSA